MVDYTTTPSMTTSPDSFPPEAASDEGYFTKLLNSELPEDFQSYLSAGISFLERQPPGDAITHAGPANSSDEATYGPVGFSNAANEAIAIVNDTKRGDLKGSLKIHIPQTRHFPQRNAERRIPISPFQAVLRFGPVPEDETSRKGGTGGLDPENRQKIAAVRDQGACYMPSSKERSALSLIPIWRAPGSFVLSSPHV